MGSEGPNWPLRLTTSFVDISPSGWHLCEAAKLPLAWMHHYMTWFFFSEVPPPPLDAARIKAQDSTLKQGQEMSSLV